MAAAIAVNAPILYGAINHWRRRSKNGSYAYAYGHGSRPGNMHTVGNPPRSQQAPHDDGEGPILCQTSVSSGFVTRDCEDGIMMKTIEVSCDKTDRVNARNSGVQGQISIHAGMPSSDYSPHSQFRSTQWYCGASIRVLLPTALLSDQVSDHDVYRAQPCLVLESQALFGY